MKRMKKVMSLVFAMVMIIAMSIPAFAANTTLTINAAEGHTYTVYQMLVGDVSGLVDGEGTLANVTAGTSLKTDTSVDEFVTAIKGKTGTALSAEAKKYIATPFATYGSEPLPCAEGYYVVVDNYTDDGKECAAYMVAVVGPTTMNPKTSIPDIDKNITDTDANVALETGDSKKTDTAAIGDVINYESKSVVPVTEGYKYYYYVVSDEMSKGLTYNKDLEIVIGTGDDAVTLEKDTDYTITETDRGFELVITDMKNLSETRKLVGQEITITYSATVNKDAEIGTIPNTNKIHLTYSNNPEDTFDKEPNDDHKPKPGDATGVTPDHITKTYVTEIVIKKVDQDGNPLAGATFELSGTNLTKVILSTTTEFVKVADDETGNYYLLNDGTYTNAAPVTDENADGYNEDKYAETTPNYKVVTKTEPVVVPTEDKKVTVTVDDKGMAVITGLNAGNYTLTETVTPEGYNTIDPISFTISAAQDGTTTKLEGTAITWSSNNADIFAGLGVYEGTIKNEQGNTLPSTGGMGTTLFYIFGSIMVIGAGVLLITKRRMIAK